MPSVEDPRGDCMSSVVGTLQYLEAARRNDVGRFVFASSGGTVVGRSSRRYTRRWSRTRSRLRGEQAGRRGLLFGLLPDLRRRDRRAALRNVYGPLSGHKNSVVARFIKRAVDGDVLEIYGDGTQTRDFIFVDDLIRAVRLGHRRGRGRRGLPDRHQLETTVQERRTGSFPPSPA